MYRHSYAFRAPGAHADERPHRQAAHSMPHPTHAPNKNFYHTDHPRAIPKRGSHSLSEVFIVIGES
jgi:hypothetical protein